MEIDANTYLSVLKIYCDLLLSVPLLIIYVLSPICHDFPIIVYILFATAMLNRGPVFTT